MKVDKLFIAEENSGRYKREVYMLEFEGISYWAVAVTWLTSVIIGAFWYSPAGFGKLWTKYTGVDHMKTPEKEATRTLISIALAALVMSFVLAVVVNSLGAVTAVEGALTGLAVWLGFTAATSVGNTLYLRLGWKLWWLNASYFLLVLVAGGALLAVW